MAEESGFIAGDIITLPISISLCRATMITYAVLIVFPFQFYIYAVFCCLWGLYQIIDGSGIIGILRDFFKLLQK
jgi:hypothetical protein